MSLNQKYTWKDHLADCPKCRPEKGEGKKRNSKEASACFDKAFQARVKEILKGREAVLSK